MIRKFFTLFLFFNILGMIYANENLHCEWVPQMTCAQNDSVVYSHSGVFNNGPNGQTNEFMSSHVSTVGDSNYDTALCCTSPLNVIEDDRLSFYSSPTTNSMCPNNDQPLFFSTDSTNGIVGLNFSTDHDTVFCAELPKVAAYANLVLDNTNFYEGRGYQCVFRVSNKTNGRVSSCDATYTEFGFPRTYEYAVWARLIESDSSLKCSSDCTSKLDNRVYSSCSSQIPACNNVPDTCDGSLYGGWVAFPTGDIDVYGTYKEQIHCQAPWTEKRINPEYVEPSFESGIKVDSVENKCSDIISQEYSVLVDNIPYKMNVFICNRG